MKNKCILFLLLTVLLISSCSHINNGVKETRESITASSDTTSDESQSSSNADTDVTTEETTLPPVADIEELVTPEPNRHPLASSDVLATIAEGMSLDDVIATVGLPQRIEKIEEMVSFSGTTSAAIRVELPSLVYDTIDGKSYMFILRTHKYDDEQNWRYEVYSVRVNTLKSTDKA